MILLIQQPPHLRHSTTAKWEQFFNNFDLKSRPIPHLWSFNFNSKASFKCFCSRNGTTHEAFQVNSKVFFMFLLFGISESQEILIQMFNFVVRAYMVLLLIPKFHCNFLFWIRVFLLCHGMPLGITILLGAQWLFTFSVSIFLWALEACLWFPNWCIYLFLILKLRFVLHDSELNFIYITSVWHFGRWVWLEFQKKLRFMSFDEHFCDCL